MKITALSGAATVALGAAAVALAAPASASAVLTQGSALSTPAGACSLTLVGGGVGYTAAECGAGAWAAGSAVRTADGELAGRVADPENAVGLARIDLAEDAEVVGDWSTRPAADVAADETVYTHGSSVPLGAANAVSRAHSVCDAADGSLLALDAATTGAGDRGGAVYDMQQRVVGVIAGTAPVTFDASGAAVPCTAGALSSVFVPVEAIDAARSAAPAPATAAEQAAPVASPAPAPAEQRAARPAPKHAATAEEPPTVVVGVSEDELPTAGESPVPESALKHYTPEQQDALAAELKARAAAHEHTVVSERATSVARGVRVEASTPTGGFMHVSVTVRDADGAVLGTSSLDLSGERTARLALPATAPVGGSVSVTAVDASDVPSQLGVRLDGVALR